MEIKESIGPFPELMSWSDDEIEGLPEEYEPYKQIFDDNDSEKGINYWIGVLIRKSDGQLFQAAFWTGLQGLSNLHEVTFYECCEEDLIDAGFDFLQALEEKLEEAEDLLREVLKASDKEEYTSSSLYQRIQEFLDILKDT